MNISTKLDIKDIPQHIAIIMDGNGRWARKKGLPRIMGHRAGSESVKAAMRACKELGVKYLTVYAFSTENWKRPQDEVSGLMALLSEMIDKEADEMHKEGIKLNILGRLEQLPQTLQDKIAEVTERMKNNTAGIFNVMLNYGARAEITDAVKKIVKEGTPAEEVSESTISSHLYTKDMPDPDLLIRTAGENRISNFLLWQIAYAEVYVTETLWPDFRKEHLVKAIEEYNKRVRKFGAVVE